MKFKAVGVLALLVLLAPAGSWAQGLFQGFSFPRTAIATGQTEIVGPVLVSLRLGTTVAGVLVVDLAPFKITNTNATDIVVTATGITVGATTIDAEKSLVKIPVNAGATAGSIRIDGIRIAVAGTGANTVTASLRWESSINVFTAGTSLTVVDAIRSGLTVEPTTTDRVVIFNGQLIDNTGTISLVEGFPSAFSSLTGFAGQTVPTRIRIRVTDLPTNLQMTFPAAVTAENSAATLTTVEGTSVTLPRGNGNGEVTYNFSGISTSDDLAEEFKIPFSVSLAGPVGLSEPTIELSLAPIGAAVPGGSLPSTDVPRFREENLLAQAGTSRIITKILYWTGAAASNRVNITNASSDAANLTIDALNASGQPLSGDGIVNPVKVTLSANESLVRTASELFGIAAGISSIRIQSTNSDVLATVVVSGTGSESVPFISSTTAAGYVPVVNEGARLAVLNPNATVVSGTLTLRTEEGRIVSSKTITLAPLASTSVALGTEFNDPLSGYVFAAFSQAVVMFESFGDGKDLNMLPIQFGAGANSLVIPFFTTGSGFQSDVNLLNVSEDLVTLLAEQYDAAGNRVGPASLITMPPNEQLATSVQRIFPQASSTGYVKLQVPQLFKGFFAYYPFITGHARIRSPQGGSTVIPASRYPLQDAFILGSGTSPDEFQGLALVNPTASAVNVTLQVINSKGIVASTNTLTLGPGQLVSRLASEFFTGGAPPQSVIRVTASSPIVISSVVGSNTLEALRSIPVLR